MTVKAETCDSPNREVSTHDSHNKPLSKHTPEKKKLNHGYSQILNTAKSLDRNF